MPTFLIPFAGFGMVALRIVIGIVFLVHGRPKVTSPSGIAQAVWGGSKVLAVGQGLVEILGGFACIVGWGLTWYPLILAVIILGALYYKIFKWKIPFMASNGTGWEFDLVLLAGLLTIALH